MTSPTRSPKPWPELCSGTASSSVEPDHGIHRTPAHRFDEQLGTYLRRADYAVLQTGQASGLGARGGHHRGPSDGIPVGVKDIVATVRPPHDSAEPRTRSGGGGERGDAVVVARLRAAAAVMTGKTTTMEFAIGLPDPTKPFPGPSQPVGTRPMGRGIELGNRERRRRRHLLGRDRHRHWRQHQDAFGAVWDHGDQADLRSGAKSGVVPLSWSFDHVGPMARTARDCAVDARRDRGARSFRSAVR